MDHTLFLPLQFLSPFEVKSPYPAATRTMKTTYRPRGSPPRGKSPLLRYVIILAAVLGVVTLVWLSLPSSSADANHAKSAAEAEEQHRKVRAEISKAQHEQDMAERRVRGDDGVDAVPDKPQRTPSADERVEEHKQRKKAAHEELMRREASEAAAQRADEEKRDAEKERERMAHEQEEKARHTTPAPPSPVPEEDAEAVRQRELKEHEEKRRADDAKHHQEQHPTEADQQHTTEDPKPETPAPMTEAPPETRTLNGANVVHAQLVQRIRTALMFGFTADALAMPVHWYYNPADITSAFGEQGVTKMHDPPARHPFDFLEKPQEDAMCHKHIVGDVIMRTNGAMWGAEPHTHVHASLRAGQNTLNAEVALLVARAVGDNKGEHSLEKYAEAYIKFMEANPQESKDTYAEQFHRNFFTRLCRGDKWNGNIGLTGHYAESVGGLVSVLPAVLLELAVDGDVPRVQKLAREHVKLTHNMDNLLAVSDALVSLVAALLLQDHAKPVDVAAAISAVKGVMPESQQVLDVAKNKSPRDATAGFGGTTCVISQSWPAVLYFLAKFHATPKDGLLANANVGGESCHRGFVIGVLLGLAGQDPHETLHQIHGADLELRDQGEIAAVIDKALQALDKRIGV